MGPGAAPAGARFSRPVRLALWQGALNAPGEWEAELREVARSAKEGGAELLLTPELCLPGFHFFGHSGFSAQREAVEARIATIASEEGLALCVGYAERRHGARDFWNTAVLVDSAGQVRHRYRKHHLWGNEANLGIVASDEDLEACPTTVPGLRARGAVEGYGFPHPKQAEEVVVETETYAQRACGSSMVSRCCLD
ncbi:unnamed protein product [Prorocentrum cordatum]|uniref:CN hydrolase domain-containing protein n=1 Tax=Prorocentrum cordatum TaxID=2364126 RepID=A0ABN9PB05_9DINO|nr:unnamed protein product [Polarella glacialis]